MVAAAMVLLSSPAPVAARQMAVSFDLGIASAVGFGGVTVTRSISETVLRVGVAYWF